MGSSPFHLLTAAQCCCAVVGGGSVRSETYNSYICAADVQRCVRCPAIGAIAHCKCIAACIAVNCYIDSAVDHEVTNIVVSSCALSCIELQ